MAGKNSGATGQIRGVAQDISHPGANRPSTALPGTGAGQLQASQRDRSPAGVLDMEMMRNQGSDAGFEEEKWQCSTNRQEPQRLCLGRQAVSGNRSPVSNGLSDLQPRERFSRSFMDCSQNNTYRTTMQENYAQGSLIPLRFGQKKDQPPTHRQASSRQPSQRRQG